MFYNFTLNTFASVVPSDYEIHNEFDESIVLPVVYDNTSTYAMGGTIALGSLGLTTASGGAILGAAASVVAPILAVVALVGGALVVGQGLVNIYDYVTDYALTKDEANSLDVSSTINKANGAMHLQLVKKNPVTNEPEPIKPNDPVFKDVGLPLINKKTNPSSTSTINPLIKYDTNDFYGSFDGLSNPYVTGSNFYGIINDSFLMLEDSTYYHFSDYVSIFNYNTSNSQISINDTSTFSLGGMTQLINNVTIFSVNKSNGSVVTNNNATYQRYKDIGNITLNSSMKTPFTSFLYRNVNTPFDALRPYVFKGYTILPKKFVSSFLKNNSVQHPVTEFVIDNDIIENLNPNIEFNGFDYVDKNLGTVVDPDDLIIPMPDIMTNDEIIYSPEIEEVIMPNGPTTGPLPNPNPNPDVGTGPGGDTDTETPPSEDQDKGFMESVKEFFLNLWDWLCNFWQNLLDLFIYLFNLFFGGLLDLLALIVDTVTNILNFLYELPSHFLNLFQELFVPSSDFFPSKFENILTGLTNKVPLFGQIKDFFTNLNLGGEGTPPKITITLPEFFGGETYDFIDFRFFEQYRSYYLNIVRVFMWIFAFKHIYRRLPGVISGGGYL